MSGQYVQLNNLHDDSDDTSRVHASAKKRAVWSIPRRWAVVGMVISCILILFYFTGSKPLYQAYTDQKSSKANYGSPSKEALLGSDEDATRLWFPPVGTTFQPSVAPYNEASRPRLRTPLFIAFTRNNAMLQQVVLSYIAAGWPREDIVVIDNSGTMDANNQGLLSTNNPFYLHYTLFRQRYGVSILQTPVLLNFPQLMNFFLRTSMAHGWRYFFWSHMDVAVLSDESATPYKSFYQHVQDILTDLGVNSLDEPVSTEPVESGTWAVKYFSYDWLTLVNVPVWRKMGQWDPFIPYYASDCDAYSRIALNGFTKDDVHAGRIFDLPDIVPNLEEKFFPRNPVEEVNSARYQDLLAELEEMTSKKPENNRNKWQGKYHGGQGEPWTYDPDGFQRMWWKTADFGRELYKEKWGTTECRLDEHGISLENMFQTGI